MTDIAHHRLPYRLSEVEHHYGEHVHVLSDPFLATQLAKLCSPDTGQPKVNSIVRGLYRDLARAVIAAAPERLASFSSSCGRASAASIQG